ncbi:hypothetical protein PSACC_02758 [Paramicrosporidium saccamoebae]|uniref:Peptidase S59 domain-containing protein n=1 Tax=Paramicrosporidium saccamoebae TaxID=1246581 RepID=A0A2H9TI61_9FUNG|nr:hypothetical protein PSACC_02758 [Paramicrosporidium saccamoebae]
MFRPFGTPGGTATPFGTPQPTQQTNSFAFGTPGGFGAPATQFGGASTGMGAPPRYSVTTGLENDVNISLHTITAMPSYEKKSLEELRLEDYLAGRKGSSAPFGAVGQPVPSSGFNSSAGIFGAPAPPAAPSNNMFGGNAGVFGGNTGTFGGNTGTFGAQPNNQYFGAPAQAAQPSTTNFGAFGGMNQPSNTQQPSGGLFGAPQSTQQPAATGFGAFGKPATTTGFGTQPGTLTTVGGGSGSLFGGAGNTGSFGTLPSTNTQSGGLFAKPATTGFGFGSNTAAPAQPSTFGAPSGGLFGAAPTQQAQPAAGLFSFGAQSRPQQQPQQQQPAQAGGFSFNAPAQQQQTSLFGTAAPVAPPSSGFSFNLGGTQPAAQPAAPSFSFGTSAPTTTQPSGGFSFNLGGAANAPTAPMFPSATSTAAVQSNMPLISAESLSIKPPIPAALSTPKAAPPTGSAGEKTASQRSPARFTPRASFRLQPPSEVSNHTGGSLVTLTGFVLPKRVSAKKLVVSDAPPTPASGSRLASLSRVASFSELPSTPAAGENDTFGEKFLIPNDVTLRKLPYAQLCSVQNFTIGQRGIGQVRFLQPVDLTKIALSDIFDRIVVFEPRLVTLYPDDEFPEDEKPAVGTGLNVAAEVRLERCWCVSKADRQPIRDMGDPRLQTHIDRLKSMPDTQFVDYLPDSGTWVFRVDHFSSYGLTDYNESDQHQSITKVQHVAGRRFSLCWLPDGSGLISRYRVSSIWTILSPPSLTVDPIKLELKDAADDEIDKALALISILKSGSREDLLAWLKNRIAAKLSDHKLASICRAELADVNELLAFAGLDRLAVMASLKNRSGDSYANALCTLAAVQLELLPSSAPAIERFTLSLLSGRVSHDFNLPWEGILLAAMHYPPSNLATAVRAICIEGDFLWNFLKYNVCGEQQHLLRALKPRDPRDWTRSYIIAHSIALHNDPVGAPLFQIIKKQLAGQLLATGQWNLAARIINLSIGPFIKSHSELCMLPVIHVYRQQDESYARMANINIFRAWKAGYLSDTLGQVDSLIEAEMYEEAQEASRGLLVDYILQDKITEATELCERICCRVPAKDLFGVTLICAYLWTDSIPKSGMIAQILSFRPADLRERAAISLIAGSFVKSNYDPSLLQLLTLDQRLGLLNQLSAE